MRVVCHIPNDDLRKAEAIPTDAELGPLAEMAQDIGRIPTPFAGYAAGW